MFCRGGGYGGDGGGGGRKARALLQVRLNCIHICADG